MTLPPETSPRELPLLPPKLYFRIGEVANLVGVEPHVLRYWEREFRSIRPTKSAKGQRVYSRKDVENLLRVRELLYAEGFTIAGAKRKLLRNAPGVDDSAQPADPSSHHAAFDINGDDPEAITTEHEPPEPSRRGGVRAASPRVRGVLLALRGEVEAFLRELGT